MIASDNNYSLSIVMPCLNEEQTVAICVQKAKQYLNAKNISGEVIVADNGSSDQSIKKAKAAGAKVIQVAEKGYGSALNSGMNEASGDYIIVADSDDSYDFSDLDCIYIPLKEGADFVIGNRFTGGIKKNAMPFLHQFIGNPVLSFLGRKIVGNKVGDYHCGLRGIRKNKFKALVLHTKGMEFATEFIIQTTLKGLKTVEVPIILHQDGRKGPSHLKPWRDGMRHLNLLLRHAFFRITH